MDVINEGLTISALGLSITFLALGIFIFVMVALQKLFPHKPEPDEVNVVNSTPASTQKTEGALDVQVEEGGEEIAAIAAAIAHLRALSQSSLGSTLESGRGIWWVKNRLAANRSGTIRK